MNLMRSGRGSLLALLVTLEPASLSASEGQSTEGSARRSTRRSSAHYEVPESSFRGTDGREVSLKTELSRPGPVLLNFIFTSCTTICSTMSATFAATLEKLSGEPVRLYSISIDPDNDTPERLKAYAARYQARERWQFLTGSLEDTIAVARAFDAYRGNKMSHAPATYLRAAPGAPWLRLVGFPSAAELAEEYHRAMAAPLVGAGGK